ncbi:ABC transporter ATP-binding protein [Mediterraneibacter sp. NSJ-55]|uniref:ABC transporter ATP-binding protein n=1 Tax=Mediterraneibacter hominis TaxID=2763054 RepID=A0A923LI48_9FIRM|nr:ABC transporter ATP-binding protein [Mediterraneibacter hominis]MBC5688449.1 ABC transporter ATP-binding protein [Mediterraneibacter hominis]
MKKERKRRSGMKIMLDLIGLVKPLLHIMTAAVLLGTLGYLCAIFLTILAGKAVLEGVYAGQNVRHIFILMAVAAILRGLLHYAEQYCNHFIAFKLLAIIRHKVFAALRKLCPAKLEGRDRGNLISIITTDIELLEVFYAHTISPIVIAVLTSLVMLLFIGRQSLIAAGLAFIAYVIVGGLIPFWNGRRGGEKGMEFRSEFGKLNSFVLDSLRGLDETIQYGQGKNQKEEITRRSLKLAQMQGKLSKMEGTQRSFTNLVILLFSFGMFFLTLFLYNAGSMKFDGVLICTLAMMGSFGPVVALSSLSNNLNQTLASGERVLSILEENPEVEEVPDEKDRQAGLKVPFTGAKAEHVDFAYEDEWILKDYNFSVKPGEIIGIHGASGSGKSTLLKLLMRFWDVKKGEIKISGRDVRKIPTTYLRDTESYVTQETHLFHDSIANNIEIGKPGASRKEIIEAAKKASIHEFIMTLPKGYDTEVGELGDTLSGGERQRIGIARAFLHNAPFLLLDEPTSNLDSLNEGVILKSLEEARKNKTVLLVSHRKSTMNLADRVFEMDNGRIS